MNKVCIVIPTYNGVERTRFLLDTAKRNDPGAFSVPIMVVEDYFGGAKTEQQREDVRDGYDMLELDFPVQVYHSPDWLNMHGNAKFAFGLAFREHNPDWVIYLGDDLAVTPGSLSNLIYFIQANDLQTVALIQPPYWNADEIARTTSEYDNCPLWSRERDFYASMEWTDKVDRKAHWDGDGIARPYVNVNGVGFACHAETYRQVGGFAEGTWCLDESISYRMWMKSERGIVCLPGPPLVHYFGASSVASPVPHDMHTHERWVDAIGFTKAECDFQMRCVMAARDKAINDEMRKASYWTQPL